MIPSELCPPPNDLKVLDFDTFADYLVVNKYFN